MKKSLVIKICAILSGSALFLPNISSALIEKDNSNQILPDFTFLYQYPQKNKKFINKKDQKWEPVSAFNQESKQMILQSEFDLAKIDKTILDIRLLPDRVKNQFGPIYWKAGKKYNLPWQILAAIHEVESNQSSDSFIRSPQGAIGPMQFLPETFWAYGVDGDGDGLIKINDVDDAIYSAANMLKANNAERDMETALYHYNPSLYYVNLVLFKAQTLGYEERK